MGYTSNTLIIRRELLKQIVTLFADGRLVDNIDRIPIQMAPKNKPAQHRCCVHKERAVIKYKMLILPGERVVVALSGKLTRWHGGGGLETGWII